MPNSQTGFAREPGTTHDLLTIVVASHDPQVDVAQLKAMVDASVARFEHFTSGHEAYDWCLRNEGRFQLAIIGLKLTDMCGGKLCWMLENVDCRTVLFIEMGDSEEKMWLRASADAVLYADGEDPLKELVECIEHFARRRTFAPEDEIEEPLFERACRLQKGTIIKDYTLREFCNKGRCGIVWEAGTSSRNEPVAIKVLDEPYSLHEVTRTAFKHEGRLLSVLSHPSLLPLIDSGCWKRFDYLVFPFVEGITGVELAQQGPVSVEIVGYIARWLFSTLSFVHSATLDGRQLNIYHRDVCPHNIVLGKSGNIYLIDFGSAKSELLKHEFGVDPTNNDKDPSWAGHQEYSAPEQLACSPDSSPAADIYGATITLYRLLVPSLYKDKFVPLPLRSTHREIMAKLTPLPKPLQSRFMESFFMKGMAETPGERFTAQEALTLIDSLFPKTREEEFHTFIKLVT